MKVTVDHNSSFTDSTAWAAEFSSEARATFNTVAHRKPVLNDADREYQKFAKVDISYGI